MSAGDAVWPPRTPALRVQHAVRLLRAGRAVRLVDEARAEIAVLSAEAGGGALDALPAGLFLTLTGRRVEALLEGGAEGRSAVIPLARTVSRWTLQALADPTAPLDPAGTALLEELRPGDPLTDAALALCKLGGLLPAALCAPASLARVLAPEAPTLPLAMLAGHARHEAASLRPVSEAWVPLADTESARLVAFRPQDGGPEQFAILLGNPETAAAPLCRLHSECFTGDLLGSLRCDCGEQLRGGIRRMAQEGSGVLLYLAQEGRGIGLANKLRAYMLQDGGLDTVEANTHLGFEPDEREYWAAAAMLEQLGIKRVRLLTNNPAKIERLRAYGIDVAGRVPHIMEPNAHNRGYLLTKALKSGHLLEVNELQPRGAARRAG